MAVRFTVLASGSAGNATLLEAGDFGLLLDAGLGPRQLSERLAVAGLGWDRVDALLLTHTHTDHWNDRTFAHMLRYRLPLWCHAGHRAVLSSQSPSFRALVTADLVREFEADEDFPLSPGLIGRALAVRHDGGATFGFRFEAGHDLFGGTCRLAHLTDLGCWDGRLADDLAGVDLLALEFNHDVALQYASGRSMRLITRVLGDDGHLSNEQAAKLLREVLKRPDGTRLRHVVQLHLSRDCNRPEIAAASARVALAAMGHDAAVHTAKQDEPLPTLHLGDGGGKRPRRALAGGRRPRRKSVAVGAWLPGFEPE